MVKKKVLAFGNMSVDHIYDSTGSLDDFVKDGRFFFGQGKVIAFPLEQKIVNLDPARGPKYGVLEPQTRWGGSLPLGAKATYGPDQIGFLRQIDEFQLDVLKDAGSVLLTENYRWQPGGPLGNTINTMVRLQKNNLVDMTPLNIECVLFGGYDQATSDYVSWLEGLSNDGVKTSVNLSKSFNTKTHEALSVNLLEAGDRNLFRLQEGMGSLETELIDHAFAAIDLKIYDFLYVNSMKNRYAMEKVVDLMDTYAGKIIVAPTADMNNRNSDATRKMISYANAIILNMEEACAITGKHYQKDMSITDKQVIVMELLDMDEGLKKKAALGAYSARQVFITDGGDYMVAGEKTMNDEYSTFALPSCEVFVQNKINAGDSTTARAVADIMGGKATNEVLRNMREFGGFYVSRPLGSDLSPNVFNTFLLKHREQPMQLQLNYGPYRPNLN